MRIVDFFFGECTLSAPHAPLRKNANGDKGGGIYLHGFIRSQVFHKSMVSIARAQASKFK